VSDSELFIWNGTYTSIHGWASLRLNSWSAWPYDLTCSTGPSSEQVRQYLEEHGGVLEEKQ